jgi:hypothetical protein
VPRHGQAAGTLLALVAGALPTLLPAQQATEVGAQVMLTTARPTAILAGSSVAFRVGRRDRLAVGLGLGSAGGDLTGRGEALWHFLLSPEAEGRPGLYGGAGLAATAGPERNGWVVATLGLDWGPGGRSGWMAEVGVGGGVRVVLGYRWRRSRDRK